MMIQACAKHIQYQLSKEFSHVGFMLEGIQCSDAGLQVPMASICTDMSANSRCNTEK